MSVIKDVSAKNRELVANTKTVVSELFAYDADKFEHVADSIDSWHSYKPATNPKAMSLKYLNDGNFPFVKLSGGKITIDLSKHFDKLRPNTVYLLDTGLIMFVRNEMVLNCTAASTPSFSVFPSFSDTSDHGRIHFVIFTKNELSQSDFESIDIQMSYCRVDRSKNFSLANMALRTKKDEAIGRSLWNIKVTIDDLDNLINPDNYVLFPRKRAILDRNVVRIRGSFYEPKPLADASNVYNMDYDQKTIYCGFVVKSWYSIKLEEVKTMQDSVADDYINGWYAYIPMYKNYVDALEAIEKQEKYAKLRDVYYKKFKNENFDAEEMERCDYIMDTVPVHQLGAEYAKIVEYIRKPTGVPYLLKKRRFSEKMAEATQTIESFNKLCDQYKLNDVDILYDVSLLKIDPTIAKKRKNDDDGGDDASVPKKLCV